MSSTDINARIKKGLARAVKKTGSAQSEKVYLVSKVKTGGGNSPINPPIFSSQDTLLLDAVFVSYDKNLIGETIRAGDRQLIVNSDVEIKAGDTVKQGATNYLVVDTGVTAPTSDVLLYKAQVRLQ